MNAFRQLREIVSKWRERVEHLENTCDFNRYGADEFRASNGERDTLEECADAIDGACGLLEDRWILLNADDTPQEGDEVFRESCGWVELNPMHFGEKVGEDSAPCRRRAV